MKMELKFGSFMYSHVNPKTQFNKLIKSLPVSWRS